VLGIDLQYLSQCVVGATLASAEEDEEEIGEEADEDKEPEEDKHGTYEVIGTLSDHARTKPDFVTEIVKVHTCSCDLGIMLGAF